MSPPNPKRIVVEKVNTHNILLSILKTPRRGLSRAEWLEQECFKVLGKDEMVRNGAVWRERMICDPDKLERVLADMRGMQKEGKAVKSPGAYARWLWGFFK